MAMSSVLEVCETDGTIEWSTCKTEETFLEDVIRPFILFNFDRIKELLDKEKSERISQSPLWISLLNVIHNMSLAEKNYLALTFLEQRWFGRRESGKGIYTTAVTELQRIEQRRSPNISQKANQNALEYLIIHLAEQMGAYVRAKQEMMDYYVKLCGIGLQKIETDFSDMLNILKAIISRYSKSFHHPILIPLRNSWNYETDIMASLLEARIQMSNWQFLPSLLKLHDAHTKLEAWGVPFKTKEPKKKLSALITIKNNSIPPLISWLVKFFLTLLSKFSFYFHETLSKQALPGDMKMYLSNLSVDYYSKVVAFQKKTDASYIILVFDTHGTDYTGHGYHFPVGYREPPKGLDSFPAVFSYPRDKPIHLWPNVIMLLSEPASGSHGERPVYFYDEVQQITYFITKVDVRMSLLLVFESKKLEKDTTISNFLQDMSSCLRGTRLLSSLKQGSKN